MKNEYFASNLSEYKGEDLEDFHIPVISVSVKENKGIYVLENTLNHLFYAGNLSFNDEICITNIRHKTALQDAFSALERVMESIDSGMPEDFYSIDLLDAYESLGSITGAEEGRESVNEIFRKFYLDE